MNRDTYRVYPSTETGKDYNYVVRGRLNGKYIRKYFGAKMEADTWAEIKNIEALNQGVEHAKFPTSLRMQAQTAIKLLEPHGVSLLEAVKVALPIIEVRRKSIPVGDAFQRFFDDYRLHGGPKKAVPSASYLAYLRDMLGAFNRTFKDRLVSDVGLPEIESLLAGRKKAGAVTRQSYIRAISAFYSWCVRQGFRLDNPLPRLRKKLPNTEVTILSIENARKLLQSSKSDEIACLVLALFCGIRIAEFRKIVRDTKGKEHEETLTWQEVDTKARQIFIPPALDKNQHGRYVDIPLNALAWLENVKQRAGPIMPERWRARRQELEKRSEVVMPQNVLRHSFCSYRIALDQDYSKAAAIVGNSPAMLRKHYVRVLPRKLGQAFFKIKPTTRIQQKVVQFKAA